MPCLVSILIPSIASHYHYLHRSIDRRHLPHITHDWSSFLNATTTALINACMCPLFHVCFQHCFLFSKSNTISGWWHIGSRSRETLTTLLHIYECLPSHDTWHTFFSNTSTSHHIHRTSIIGVGASIIWLSYIQWQFSTFQYCMYLFIAMWFVNSAWFVIFDFPNMIYGGFFFIYFR